MCTRCCHCDVRTREHDNETVHHTDGATFPITIMPTTHKTQTQCKPKVTHESMT